MALLLRRSSFRIIFILLLLAQPPLRASAGDTISRMQVIHFAKYTVVSWINPKTGGIFSCIDSHEAAIQMFPILRTLSPHILRHLRHCRPVPISMPTSGIVDITVNDKQDVIAVDSSAHTIYRVELGSIFSSHSSVITSSDVLHDPISAVELHGYLYVLERNSTTLKVFYGGVLVQSVPLANLSLERLINTRKDIYGVDFQTKRICHFLLADKLGPGPRTGPIQGFQTTSLPSLGQPTDITYLSDSLVILDSDKKQLALWSQDLPDLIFANLPGQLQTPLVLASDGATIFFADTHDGSLVSMAPTIPTTFVLNGAEPSESLVAIYEYLYKSRLLPLTSYQIRAGDSVESIAESRDLLPNGFTPMFTPLFCKMNRQQCHGGLPVLRPSTTVQIPDLPLHTYIGKSGVTTVSAANSGASTYSLQEVADVLSGSQTQTGNCLITLSKPNSPPLPLANKETQTGSQQTPASPCPLIKTIPSGANASPPTKLASLLQQRDELIAKLTMYNPEITGDSARNAISKPLVIPGLLVRTSALIPVRGSRRQRALWATLKGRVQVAQVSVHPSVKSLEYPRLNQPLEPQATSALAPSIPPKYFELIHKPSLPNDLPVVTIGVVEDLVNEKHPEFMVGGGRSRVSRYSAAGGNQTVETVVVAPAVGGASDASDIKLDHGTLVSALIAGSKVGLDPTVRIQYIANSAFTTAVSEGPFRIFNLSLGEPELFSSSVAQGGIADLLAQWETLIKASENEQTLFIVAAGNEDHEVTNGMLGGAGALSNVIVVSAANGQAPLMRWRAPDGIHAGNWSTAFVDVYGPGDSIESATLAGSYGVSSGTSQATAIVTGLAALLLQANPFLSPWQIKERIVATSDLEPWMTKPEARAGLINVERAINDLSFDVITMLDPATGKSTVCKGTIDDPSLRTDVDASTPRQNLLLHVGEILRLHKNRNGGQYTIIYDYKDPNRKSDIDGGHTIIRAPLAVPQASLSKLTQLGWFPDPAGPCADMNAIDLTQVTDFYSSGKR